jgi:beta-lactamase regulating signal transducer with metallopeptidase domain
MMGFLQFGFFTTNLTSMSLSGALLILIIVGIRATVWHRLPKLTFQVLWCVVLIRLLVPFSLTASWSVLSLWTRFRPVLLSWFPLPGESFAPLNPLPPEAESSWHFSPLTAVWLLGVAVLAAYFLKNYCRCLREFSSAEHVRLSAVTNWLAQHKILRRVRVLSSRKINTPLTYGFIRPVILLPAEAERLPVANLEHILAHEFVHIRRFDTLTKLLVVAALCLHWFNPLVWLMFIVCGRDIEIACDERVVCSLGEDERAAYAQTLLMMEEKKKKRYPLVNTFGMYALEERIVSILKMKKAKCGSFVQVFILVFAVITCLGTAPPAAENTAPSSLSVLANLDVSDWEYLDELGLLTKVTTMSGPRYFYGSKCVLVIYDPHNGNGTNYSSCAWYDVDGEAKGIGVKVLRDSRTGEVVGISEMSVTQTELVLGKFNKDSLLTV